MRRDFCLVLLCLSLSANAAPAADPAGIAAIRQAVFSDPDLPVIGNPDGRKVLVEFSDYNCGFCRRAAPEVAALLAADPDIKLVVHEIPIFGEGSREAAMAALAAQRQGRYGQFHAALMAMRGKAERVSVLRVARETGLDIARLERDMQDPAITAQIEQSLALADDLGLMGTPSFIAGDHAMFGYMTRDALADMLAE